MSAAHDNDNAPPACSEIQMMNEEQMICVECGSVAFRIMKHGSFRYVLCWVCGADVTDAVFSDI